MIAASPLPIPSTYAEWAAILDVFQNKTDDADVLRVMQLGRLEWQAGVAERFTLRLADALNCRLDKASDKFTRDLSCSRNQESVIVQALLALRKELSFLAMAMDLPVIPTKDRAKYRQLVLDRANTIQNSLTESARKDHTGKLAVLVKNHSVNKF